MGRRVNPRFILDYARKYGKPDVERLGVFVEMPYMNGKGYVSSFPKPRPDKGRNMIAGGAKIKAANQDGYFEDKFKRLFIGECIKKSPERLTDSDERRKKKQPFMPPSVTKKIVTSGDYWGTFGGQVSYFSRQEKEKEVDLKPKKKPRRPCVTNPAKKGGPGYIDIGLSKYPEHMDEPYPPVYKYKRYGKNLGSPIKIGHHPQPYFDDNPFREETQGPIYVPPKQKGIELGGHWIPNGPSKWRGGCHAGMFSPYPEYTPNRDPKAEKKLKKLRAREKLRLEEKGKFLPHSTAFKNLLTTSILYRNTDIRCNETAYRTCEPAYCRRLLRNPWIS